MTSLLREMGEDRGGKGTANRQQVSRETQRNDIERDGEEDLDQHGLGGLRLGSLVTPSCASSFFCPYRNKMWE